MAVSILDVKYKHRVGAFCYSLIFGDLGRSEIMWFRVSLVKNANQWILLRIRTKIVVSCNFVEYRLVFELVVLF
jgi:hypothetical protein